MVRDEAPRTFKTPCRACGDTVVKVWVTGALEPNKEIVVGECRSCGNRRSRYYRLIKPAPRST